MRNRDHKPSIFISILCGQERQGWINPELTRFLCDAAAIHARGERQVKIDYTIGKVPHDSARNQAAAEFLKTGFDWQLTIDNDQAISTALFDMIDQAPADGAVLVPRNYMHRSNLTTEPSLVWWGSGQPIGEWASLAQAGSGVMAIRRDTYKKIQAPYFRFGYSADGIMDQGEDEHFCQKVTGAGLKIYGNVKHLARHYHAAEIADIAFKLGRGDAAYCALTASASR